MSGREKKMMASELGRRPLERPRREDEWILLENSCARISNGKCFQFQVSTTRILDRRS
jgi:hypothetical protein